MLKLIVTNFKKYTCATFEFAAAGLSLLDGKSGAGKTTILKAILFCLYGKSKKPVTFGVTGGATVIMEYRGLHITRSTKPNLLQVVYQGVKYQAEPAQGIIDHVIGLTEKQFLIGCCLTKKNSLSILSLTPTEQLAFLETIINSETSKINPHDAKTKIKAAKQYNENETARLSLQLEHYTGLAIDMKTKLIAMENITSIKNINTWRTQIDITSDIAKKKQQRSNIEKKLAANQKQLQEIRDIEKNREKYRNELLEKQAIYKNLEETQHNENVKDSTKNRLTDLEKVLDKKKQVLKKYKQDEEIHRRLLKYLEDKNSFEQLYLQPFLKEIDNELVSRKWPTKKLLDAAKKTYQESRILEQKYQLELALYKNQQEKKAAAETRIADIKNNIKSLFSCFLSIDSLLLFLKKYRRKLEIIKSKKLCCPECQAKLVFINFNLESIDSNELEIMENGSKFTISQIDNFIADIEKFGSLETSLVEPEPYTFNLKKLEQELKIMELDFNKYTELINKKTNLSPSLKSTQETLRQRWNSMPNIAGLILEKTTITNDQYIEKYNEQDIQEQLNDDDDKIKDLEKNITELNVEIAGLKKTMTQLDTLRKECETLENLINIGNIASSIDLENGISDLSKKYKFASDILVKLEQEFRVRYEYDTYMEFINDLGHNETKIKTIQDSLIDLEKMSAALMSLDQDAKKAQALALESVIDKINTRSKEYMELMFEYPLSVELAILDNSKIGIQVCYQGFSTATLDDLSEGEYQRCELAFCLAVNDLMGAGILLLDECLNHLNTESHAEILGYIKELCGEKCVLVISHQEMDAKEDIYSGIVKIE